MTRFLATTATTLILSTAAHADGHMNAFSEMQFDAKTNVNASELIGARVYATESDIMNDAIISDDGEKEWDDIGEINEIVLTRDGKASTVILGVGGFLGMGEKDVAIDMSQLKFVSDGEDSDEYFLVVNANAAGVEEAPSYNMTNRAAMSDDAMAKDANEAMEDDAMTDDAMARPLMTRPNVERDGFQDVMPDDLNTEDLTGARVYGINDEDVGEISELLMTTDGKIDRAVIDVGGFLGLGEHSVAVTMDELQIVREDNGDDVRVYIDSSEEALEKQPEYEG